MHSVAQERDWIDADRDGAVVDLTRRLGLGSWSEPLHPYNPHPNILAVLRSCMTATARPASPPPKMRVRRFARTILATARPQLTETRADLGALASTTASAEVDDPMIVARIARSWTGAPLCWASQEQAS